MRRQLDIDTHPVCQTAEPFEQAVVRSGDCLSVNIAAETVILTQDAQRLNHALASVIRIFDNAGAEKKPLNIVALIEVDGQISKLPRGESRPLDVVGHTVYAVQAVIDTGVAHEHFEQRYAAAVRGKGMADTAGDGVADGAARPA